MTQTVYNFCSGPAMVPASVLLNAQQALLDWQHTGMSILSVSHRSEEFLAMASAAKADLRALLHIPEEYEILLLQGGATQQFAQIPLNLLGHKPRADYVVTGVWGQKAYEEAQRYGEIKLLAQGVDAALNTDWPVSDEAAYVHCTPNETIDGIEFTHLPHTSVPIVADMSSTILSRPIDVSRYGLIYAGAQKNIGPAGLVVVIVRKDLLHQARVETPHLLRYEVQAKAESLYNTPPTFAWYLMAEVFKWLKQQGGLSVMAARNQAKAEALYQEIDRSGFYYNKVPASCRSWMNVPFSLKDAKLESVFLQLAEQQGLTNLKGHRLVGGCRASIYNAMPQEGVKALIQFMQEFERQYG